MSTPALTIHPGTTLAQAARIMAVEHVKRLPAVDDLDIAGADTSSIEVTALITGVHDLGRSTRSCHPHAAGTAP
ncbi:CBS domain-containing protein [Streptomyces sp. NPDC058442]|uniref:CBS domain-containing protein n=1 Tax=Streptomyces sp. NPDC058442 TaxID=3346503 RepID=UPI003662AAC6